MQDTTLDQLLPKEITARLLAFRHDLVQALPGSVEDVILFGSRARGDAQEGSDYDLAVLLNGRLADDQEVCRRISDVAWEHQEDGYFLQVVPLDAAAFRPRAAHRTELVIRIVAEGVSVG
jgi:uncharacterized protein